MIPRFSTNFAVFAVQFDLIVIAGSLYFSRFISNFIKFGHFLPLDKMYDLPLLLYFLFPIVWVLVFFFLSVYDGKKNISYVYEFTYLSIGSILSALIISGFLFLSYREVSRLFFLLFIALTVLLLLFWRIIFHFFYKRRIIKKDYKTRILIVGAGKMGIKLRQHLLTLDPNTYHFVGFLDDSFKSQVENKEIIGSIDSIGKIIKSKRIHRVFITLPKQNEDKLDFIISELEALPVRISIIPEYISLSVYPTSASIFAGLPTLELKSPKLTESQRIAKRLFDIFVTSLLMIPAVPVMGIIALLILLFDGKPILFKQNRVGENGKIIKIYKFRTMYVGSEKLNSQVAIKDENGNIIIKRKDDPRVTPLGRYPRRFSLDELPQFFNVLRGTISLVGPRPELPEIVEQYQPWQRARLSMPQGLTGWWQIQGRSDKPMHLNTEYDLYYVEHYSIFLDFMIVIKTFWTAIIGHGAY